MGAWAASFLLVGLVAAPLLVKAAGVTVIQLWIYCCSENENNKKILVQEIWQLLKAAHGLATVDIK